MVWKTLKIFFISVFLFLLFAAAVIFDSERYLGKMDLDAAETLEWVAREVGVEPGVKLVVPVVKLMSQRELEEAWVAPYAEISPAVKSFAEDYLGFLKANGFRLAGFYYHRDKVIRLSRDHDTKIAYVHEMTHYVIDNFPNRYTDGKKQLTREENEKIAVAMSVRFVKSHRWSVRLIYGVIPEAELDEARDF